MREHNSIVYFFLFLILIIFSAVSCSRARSFAETEQQRKDIKISEKEGETTLPLPDLGQQNDYVGYRVLEIPATDFTISTIRPRSVS